MKILFYCNSIFTFGGVQRVLAVIAEALSKQHEITILTLDNPDIEDRKMYQLDQSTVKFDYIKYHELPRTEYLLCKSYSFLYKRILPHNKFTSGLYAISSFPPEYQKKLINKINHGKYDVVIGVHAFLCFHLASVQKKIQAQTVGWMHNSYQAFFEMTPAYLKGLQNHFKHQMPKLGRIVVLTDTDRNLYRIKLNFCPQVIYNPLTIRFEESDHPEYKKFLAVGRLAPRHKGFDLLINAFARFAAKNKEWTLEIVGEGPEENSLRAMIDEYSLESRITLHPFTKEIEKHYNHAGVYILSSRWEGFPLVLAEAMSYHLPVIASDLPVVKELLSEGKNALFFQNGDVEELARKMLQMAEQENIQQMGKEAYLFSKELSIESISTQWNNLLTELSDNPITDTKK